MAKNKATNAMNRGLPTKIERCACQRCASHAARAINAAEPQRQAPNQGGTATEAL
ncbi:MAG: hypothetical protein IJ754_03655 [Bacteroidaceae bacterium]|nr:hypothetical protein [Bacteroidaceae bacterium]